MSKIVQKHKDLFGKYHFIITPLIVALLGALGYGEYEKRQEPATVTVNVESMPAVMTAHHDHHDHRSIESIQAMIDRSVQKNQQQHEQGGKFH